MQEWKIKHLVEWTRYLLQNLILQIQKFCYLFISLLGGLEAEQEASMKYQLPP